MTTGFFSRLFSSKTVWFNTLTTVATVLGYLNGTVQSPQVLVWITLFSGIVNLILRTFFTSTPIA